MTKGLDYDKIVKGTCDELKKLPLTEQDKEEIHKIKKAIDTAPGECRDIIKENGLGYFLATLLKHTNIPRKKDEAALKYYNSLEKENK